MPHKTDIAIAVAGLGALAWALTRDNNEYRFEEAPYAPPENGDSSSDVETDDAGTEYVDEENDMDAKLYGFLYMIRASEHTLADARSGKAYQVFYGGSTFTNMSDHPVLTKEKAPVQLPDDFCRKVGLGPGCVSTAAGAYQITRPTWNQFRAGGSWGPYLPDFSNGSQDEAARRILIRDGVLPLLYEGRLSEAIHKAAARWASLPGSTAGQGGKTLDYVVARYNEGVEEYASL